MISIGMNKHEIAFQDAVARLLAGDFLRLAPLFAGKVTGQRVPFA